ncbi:MAG: hypothetical protein WCP19_07245 [Chloroflexota bacterium]
MKKLPLNLLLFTSMFILSLSSTAIHQLSTLGSVSDTALTPILHGQLLPLFESAAFWAAYPALPAFSQLFLSSALIVMLLLLGLTGYYLLILKKTDPAIAGLAFLLLGAIPALISLTALRGNQLPEIAGPWLAFMLTGILYSSTASTIYSLAVLVKVQPPSRIK